MRPAAMQTLDAVASSKIFPKLISLDAIATIADSVLRHSSASMGLKGMWIRGNRSRVSGSGKRSVIAKPQAPMTSIAEHPAKQCNKILPSSTKRIVRLGERSSCEGHRAIHLPPALPALTPCKRDKSVSIPICSPSHDHWLWARTIPDNRSR